MEQTHTFSTSQHAIASPKGTLIASLTTSRLEIRRSKNLQLIRSIPVPAKFTKASIYWSPSSDSLLTTSRIALVTSSSVLLLNIAHPRENTTAKIEIGSGGAGQITAATFGNSDNEFLTFSDFGFKASIWNLLTGKSVEVRDPKFSTKDKGYAFRPPSGHLVILSRVGAQDYLTMLAVNSRDVIWSVALSTLDAQRINWSPDGKFLAVTDAAGLGYNVHIYTAAGGLFRSYNGDDSDVPSLGIISVQWSLDSSILALGGYDGRVRLLNARTFSPMVYLDHSSPIEVTAPAQIWQEQRASDTQRSFEVAAQPAHPPAAAPQQNSTETHETGISNISFSTNGKYLLARNDNFPTTLWIWDLTLKAIATIMIHQAPIKDAQWHPTTPDLLLIQCAQEQPLIYLWEGPQIVPSAWPIPFTRGAGKITAKWLDSASITTKPSILYGDARNSTILWPRGRDLDVSTEEEGEESTIIGDRDGLEQDVDESFDSVYQALTGRQSPFKGGDTEILVSEVDEDTTEILDDTFHGRRGLKT